MDVIALFQMNIALEVFTTILIFASAFSLMGSTTCSRTQLKDGLIAKKIAIALTSVQVIAIVGLLLVEMSHAQMSIFVQPWSRFISTLSIE